jgi:hypothetical protein
LCKLWPVAYVIGLRCADVKDVVEAMFYEEDLRDMWRDDTADNARFVAGSLPRRPAPLGTPGGATKPGPLDAATPMVAALPPRSR